MTNYSTTRLDVTQIVQTGGGQIIGASINQLAGNLIIDSIRDDPPDERSVIAYLKQIKEPSLPPDILESVQKLWQLPFRAHVPGQVTGEAEDLLDAVLAGFERNRRLGRGRRVVLLADAGMGKTPALKHLRARLAQQSFASYGAHSQAREADATARLDKENFVVPLMINLADLANNISLYSLVHEAFNAIVTPNRAEGVDDMGLDQLPAFLNSYRCLILLDGLDELISNRRSGGLHLIRRFMDTHPEQLYVISCRTSSYREQLGAIETLYLNDLEETQAEEVLGESRYRQLSQSLRQLARNRSLLSLILELEEDASLLENKGQLLKMRMKQRLQPASADHSRDSVDIHLLQRVLAHLAIAMHLDHTLYFDERRAMEVTRACLETWHEKWHWRHVLQVLQDRGVLQRDDEQGQWRFVERSDQAYFAAAAIIAHPEHLESILNEVSDYWWREMFEVLVGLLADPTNLFFELIDRDALVAANSIQYAGRTVHDQVTNAVVDALVVRMRQESSARCKYIVQRIGESDHPRAPEALFLALHREWSSLVVRAIAQALVGWWQRHPQINLASAEKDAFRFSRRQTTSVAGIVKLYSQAQTPGGDRRAKARQQLLDTMQDRQQPSKARGLAAIYLGLLAAAGNGDEALWQPLLELFQQPDIDTFVAWCVTEALTDSRVAGIESLAVSFRQDKRYRTRKWRQHRARATYLLGWVSRDESTCQLLWSALKDGDPLVRGFAIDAIARLDLPQAREHIQSLMTGDARRETDPDVLRRMAEALAQIGTVDSIPILQQYLCHERTYTRWAMHKAIDEIRERYGL